MQWFLRMYMWWRARHQIPIQWMITVQHFIYKRRLNVDNSAVNMSRARRAWHSLGAITAIDRFWPLPPCVRIFWPFTGNNKQWRPHLADPSLLSVDVFYGWPLTDIVRIELFYHKLFDNNTIYIDTTAHGDTLERGDSRVRISSPSVLYF